MIHKFNLAFSTLPQGDPIIKRKAATEHFIAVFLEKWNTPYDVDDLMEYLNIVLLSQTDHEDYQEIINDGIYDDVQSTLFFKDQMVQIFYNEQYSDTIALDDFIAIVTQWKAYLVQLQQP